MLVRVSTALHLQSHDSLTEHEAHLDVPGISAVRVVGDFGDGSLGEGQRVRRMVSTDRAPELYISALNNVEAATVDVLQKNGKRMSGKFALSTRRTCTPVCRLTCQLQTMHVNTMWSMLNRGEAVLHAAQKTRCHQVVNTPER